MSVTTQAVHPFQVSNVLPMSSSAAPSRVTHRAETKCNVITPSIPSSLRGRSASPVMPQIVSRTVMRSTSPDGFVSTREDLDHHRSSRQLVPEAIASRLPIPQSHPGHAVHTPDWTTELVPTERQVARSASNERSREDLDQYRNSRQIASESVAGRQSMPQSVARVRSHSPSRSSTTPRALTPLRSAAATTTPRRQSLQSGNGVWSNPPMLSRNKSAPRLSLRRVPVAQGETAQTPRGGSLTAPHVRLTGPSRNSCPQTACPTAPQQQYHPGIAHSYESLRARIIESQASGTTKPPTVADNTAALEAREILSHQDLVSACRVLVGSDGGRDLITSACRKLASSGGRASIDKRNCAPSNVILSAFGGSSRDRADENETVGTVVWLPQQGRKTSIGNMACSPIPTIASSAAQTPSEETPSYLPPHILPASSSHSATLPLHSQSARCLSKLTEDPQQRESYLSDALATLASSSQMSERMLDSCDVNFPEVPCVTTYGDVMPMSKADSARRGETHTIHRETSGRDIHGAHGHGVPHESADQDTINGMHDEITFQYEAQELQTPPRAGASGVERSMSASAGSDSTQLADGVGTQECYSIFTHAIGKAVEILAEKKGLEYVAQTLVAELDVLKAEEDVQEKSRGRSTPPRDSSNNSTNVSKPSEPCHAVPLQKPVVNGNQQSLSHAFRTFSDQHTQKMDTRSFAKLCKELNIFDKAFTQVDVDLIISRVLAGTGQRRLDFPKFEQAMRLVARRKGIQHDELLQLIIDCSGSAAESAHAETALGW